MGSCHGAELSKGVLGEHGGGIGWGISAAEEYHRGCAVRGMIVGRGVIGYGVGILTARLWRGMCLSFWLGRPGIW